MTDTYSPSEHSAERSEAARAWDGRGAEASHRADLRANGDLSAVFGTFLARLQAEMGADSWRAWGARLRAGESDSADVRVFAPSALHCSRIVERVGGERRLRALWQEIDPARRRVSLIPDPLPREAEEEARPAAERAEAPQGEEAGRGARNAAMARTFDTFVVGAANKVAYATARAMAGAAEPPSRLAVIHGAYGAGKTHLLRAVESEVNAGERGQRALYFSADRFRMEYVKALRAKAGIEFKQHVQAAEILLIDDLHMLANARSTQAELLHAVNEVLSDGGRVLLAADRPAEALSELDDGLRARLSGAVHCEIEQPDLDLRRDILKACADANGYVRQGLVIPPEVLDFIASAVIAMPRDLEAAFATLITRTALIGVPVTRATAAEALADTLNGARRRITVEDIQKTVAHFHGLKVSDLLSKRRTREIVRPRQEAMFLCKEFTTRSLPDIARRFGGMDHTTVMHAVKRIKGLVRDDPTVRSDIDALRQQLSSRRTPSPSI
ncbi:MAG: DnaA/Hda family protein [Caulobacterales bacterium]|nr:DnaA/Hda family protein [Caulobacterales bacterium]